ncbi:MAG TPA: hypothetical protein VF862_13305 [Gemmatimonadales bacterium]
MSSGSILSNCRVLAGALLVLLTTHATGCTSWQTVPPPWPDAVRPGHTDSRIRVELASGTRIVADSGRTRPDSLVVYEGEFTQFVPWSMVRKLEVRRFNALKSVPMFLGIGLVGAAVACAQVCDFGGFGGGGGGGCTYFCGTPSAAFPPDAH